MAGELEAVLAAWRPAPLTATGTIDAAPAARLAATLDLPGPAPADGAELAPCWHWLYFLDWPAGREIDPDGHPTSGPFLPPVPQRRRMIAGGRLQLLGPLRIGRPASRKSRLLSSRVVQGGTGEFVLVTLQHEISQDGVLCLVEQQDLAYRSGDGASPRQRPARLGDQVPAGRRFSADPVLLFRFSALTGNAHRIHYDEPYAVGVESYPGLVVHGPLLAMVLARAAARVAAGRPLTELSFRLVAPVFAGDVVEVDAAGPAAGEVVGSVIRDGAGNLLASCQARLGQVPRG